MTITANGKNGIKSGATTDEDGEASLTIRDLTLNIDAPVNDAINAEQLLNVESGTLTIDAYSSAGDGFDSNGDLTITGDTVIVWTANTADNEPRDADGTITVSGGTVLAAGGSSGMGGGFPGGGQKPDGEPPESFDGQMPNGEKSELPDGEVPEMPSGERPTPPSGQGSPADGNAPAGDSTSDTTPTA